MSFLERRVDGDAKKSVRLIAAIKGIVLPLSLIVLIILTGSSISARQAKADGSLISSFGTGGVIQENPSGVDDRASKVAVDGSYMYIVGWDTSPGNIQWRMEKRTLTTGSLIWARTSNPTSGNDYASDVAVDGSGVYIVGSDQSPGTAEWRIEKRSLTTGSLISSFGTGGVIQEDVSGGTDVAVGVAVDGSGVYIVGSDQSPGEQEWRVEKRDLATGSLTWARTGNPSSGWDCAYGVAVDGSGVYIVGLDSYTGDYEWRIEKRYLTNGRLIWSRTSNPTSLNDAAYGVAVDGSSLYIVGYDASGSGEWRIEKMSTTGSLIWARTSNPSNFFDVAVGVAVDGSGVYIVGYDTSPGTAEWRIEKRSLTTGSLISSFGTGGVIQEDVSGGTDAANGVAVDGSGVYIVGYDTEPGNLEWRIEKRSLGAPVPDIEYSGDRILNAAAGQVRFTHGNLARMSAPTSTGAAYDSVGLGVIYSLCLNDQLNCFDDDPSLVETSGVGGGVDDLGKPKFTDASVVTCGSGYPNGPNYVVGYYSYRSKEAPIKDVYPGEYALQKQDGTPVASRAFSWFDGHHDLIVVMAFMDSQNNYVMSVYGYTWVGTWAGAIYYCRVIAPDLASYPYSYLVLEWADTNGDGIPQVAELIQVASG